MCENTLHMTPFPLNHNTHKDTQTQLTTISHTVHVYSVRTHHCREAQEIAAKEPPDHMYAT